MLDLSRIERSPYATTVHPSNNIFTELGMNTYDYKDLLSELIDNSVAARRQDRTLEVRIDIYVDDDGKATDFVVRDNASGIAVDRLGAAIAPAGVQSKDSLNEHGLGMKQAVATLGQLRYLATKTQDETRARLIQEFKFGDLETFYVDFDQDTGTDIAITNLKPIVVTHAGTITRSIVPYLGARYRRFLRPDDKLLDLQLSIKSAHPPHDTQYHWSVSEVKPVYFHPSTRLNQPVILSHKISGRDWEAKLTFGYAPDQEAEYQELGLERPNKFHPYRVSLSKQGLDLILHDRVILFHQLAELDMVSAKHNRYNDIRGEIDLIRGFSTAITKNSIIFDDSFRECVDKIRKILNGDEPGPGAKVKDYLTRKTYPEEVPERLLRDRLAEWLANNPLNKRTNIKTEYVVKGIEGYIDIFADNEAWEVKTDQASALDVYQLFMYMDVGEIGKGFLVAEHFTTGAEVAAEHIKEKHSKEIVLAVREQFPINHRPNNTEIEEYY